jgi:glycine dehydrogenase subunit 2
MSQIREIQRAFHQVEELLEASHGGEERFATGYVRPAPENETEGLWPKDLLRERIENFPQLSEVEVVRHFTKLSQLNFGIDSGSYPLGSCTMKYNPKVNERVAAEEGFSSLHPYTPEKYSQGALAVMYELQQALIAITGLKGCSLHPAAGAHGELVGVKMINAYHQKNGQKNRKTMIVPDSAHGTNPASAALCGLKVKQMSSSAQGIIDVSEVEKTMDDTVAALMITVPNTLGIFESNIVEVARVVHERGGLVYCDGANLNALVGQVDFKAMGVDCMHINLHKTFSTPHGGGGPGAGPVVVSDKLVNFLPAPIVRKRDNAYVLDEIIPHSVGRFRAFHGNFAMLLRALCYMYAFGKEKLAQISEVAVLNANYIKSQLRDCYHLPYDQPSMHEVVFTDKLQQKDHHVTTLDIAKRLMDFGIHPPTIYFPLVVRGALMIEPTESESKAELDRLIAAMKKIAEEASKKPTHVTTAPHNAGIRRLDETLAAREPVLTWNQPTKAPTGARPKAARPTSR